MARSAERQNSTIPAEPSVAARFRTAAIHRRFAFNIRSPNTYRSTRHYRKCADSRDLFRS
jgi:hypothetical protein